MSRRSSICFLFLVICSLSLYANSGKTFPLSSRIYDQMDALYAIEDLGTPSNSRPWSYDEALLILKRVDLTRLSGPSLELYRIVEEEIEYIDGLQIDGVTSIDAGATVNLEMYAHTNTGYDKESDWSYDYEKRKPLLYGFLEFSFFDTVYSFCDIRVGNGKYYGRDEREQIIKGSDIWPEWGIGAIITELPGSWDELAIQTITHSYLYSNHFNHNILFDIDNFDSIFPKRAMLSVGGSHWFASFGRDRLDWGNSNIGNLVIDNHVDFHDYLRLTFFSDKFKYEFLTLFLEKDLSCRQTPDTGSKFLIAHRLEYRPIDRLTLSISENVMYVTDGVLELKYFNPAFIFHNLDNHSLFNAIAHIELDFQPVKGLNLYTQFVLDQATAPGEGSDQGGAWGILAGGEYTKAFSSVFFTTSLEGVYTSPLLYRRDGVDFLIISKNKLSTTGGYVVDIDFLGFPYGNDSIVIQSKNAFEFFNGIKLGATIREVIKGTFDIYTSHSESNDNTKLPDRGGTTPYGDAVYFTTILSLAGEVPLNAFCPGLRYPDISFAGSLTYIGKSSKNIYRDDLQLALSCSISF